MIVIGVTFIPDCVKNLTCVEGCSGGGGHTLRDVHTKFCEN